MDALWLIAYGALMGAGIAALIRGIALQIRLRRALRENAAAWARLREYWETREER